MPKLIIVAGVNGAGKTTLTKNLIDELGSTTFIINPDEMGYRESIRKSRQYLNEKKDFLKETTLTGKGIFNFIELAKLQSYQIGLFYLSVNDCDICIERVKDRVKLGGHHVSEADIIRRFKTSRENLITIIPKIDFGIIIDSSYEKENYKEIAKIKHGNLFITNESTEYSWIKI
jgi:predicted ABC-type ATPase